MSATNQKTKKINAFLVSDVHLNSHGFNKTYKNSDPKREIFESFLDKLLAGIKADESYLLILNGDIIDVTGSWFDTPLPWDEDKDFVERLLNKVLLEIINNNISVSKKLKKFLSYKNNEIIFVIGNHDGMFELYPESQEYFKNRLLKDEEMASRFKFCTSYENEELSLYAEHGHRLDPYNFYDNKNAPPLGDVINVLVVNRFMEKTVSELKKYGYKASVINKVADRVYDVEYIRPLVLLPLWVETIAKEQYLITDGKEKNKSLEQVFRNIATEILLEEQVVKHIFKTLKIPLFLLKGAIKLLITFPVIMPIISYLCTKLVRRTHSNDFQIKSALKISREKKYKFICFGHTHIPMMKAITPDTFYFNTASWTPVIHLFEYSSYELGPEEFINPDEHLKKIGRYGILKITKDLNEEDSKPEFNFELVQMGNT